MVRYVHQPCRRSLLFLCDDQQHDDAQAVGATPTMRTAGASWAAMTTWTWMRARWHACKRPCLQLLHCSSTRYDAYHSGCLRVTARQGDVAWCAASMLEALHQARAPPTPLHPLHAAALEAATCLASAYTVRAASGGFDDALRAAGWTLAAAAHSRCLLFAHGAGLHVLVYPPCWWCTLVVVLLLYPCRLSVPHEHAV